MILDFNQGESFVGFPQFFTWDGFVGVVVPVVPDVIAHLTVTVFAPKMTVELEI